MEPIDLATFERRTDRCWRAVHGSNYQQLGPMLADLIPRLEKASRLGPPSERHHVFELLANAYQVASAMMVKMGDAGAAWIAADRAIAAGERCDDRNLVLAAQLRMSRTFSDSGERDLARHLLKSAIKATSDLTKTRDAGLLSLVGASALLLAIIDARDGNAKSARSNIGLAERTAMSLGGDRNEYGTEFGPTNVTMHAVAVEVELGNGQLALDKSKKVRFQKLSPERQARYLLDVAQAHALCKDTNNAVATLEVAEGIAPQEISQLPRARALIQELCDAAGKRAPKALNELRQRVRGH